MKQLNKELEKQIELALQMAQTSGELPEFEIPAIPVSPPKRAGQGDLSYPAMGLAKLARKKPLDIANLIAAELGELAFLERIDVAPPGFINFSICHDYLRRQVEQIICEGELCFQLDIGAGEKAQVEFVSANPSGPITIGHTRNAVIGDAMARLLEAAGYEVQREYYYNNAGNQMIVLGKSLMLRYLQQLGEDVTLPDDHYQGEYLIEIATELAEQRGDALKDESWETFKDIVETRMFDWINRSLDSIDVRHDAFFNETSLFESEQIWQVLDALRDKGHIYEAAYWEGADEAEIADVTTKGYQPATWFRSTSFGDEKDRVMVKSDGEPTYTLPDIAYHRDKLKRGFDVAVNVLGTDHFSQAQVVKCGVEALGMDPEPMHVIFIQMVRAVRWNKERGEYKAVKQSKRAGNFDTLDELVAMTSADAVRYHMLARSPNAQLDFDVDQVVKQTNDNPVYYIQNAYVRCAGIFREADERGISDEGADLSLLGDNELKFIRKALELGNVIEQAVVSYEPHKIAFFAHELAAVFHPIYDKVRVLHTEVPPDVAKARLRFYRAAGCSFQSVAAPDGHVRAGAHVTLPDEEKTMGLKPDHWIRAMVEKHRMIDPFVDRQVRDGSISYGVSSYGYDLRVSDDFKIFTNVHSAIVDPKNFADDSFVDFRGDVCIIPPNSFVLSRSVEYFRIPRKVLTICLGKSTYARCGLIVNVTPFEPEWEGYVTLEISNTTPLPAKVYANEGLAQVLFFEADEVCEQSYADKKGKYQGQTGVTPPRM